jgi:hypothetical protein
MDSFHAEASAQRQAALVAIRARVGEYVGGWLRDDECVQVVIASSMRCNKEVIEFLFKPNVARDASKALSALAITPEEWVALFGYMARPTRGAQLERLALEDGFRANTVKIQNALRTTVGEETQGQAWSRGWTQAACMAAMHAGMYEEFVSACLGNVVRADLRRMEDLQTELDDSGADTMLLGQLLGALSESVT